MPYSEPGGSQVVSFFKEQRVPGFRNQISDGIT
jgi:hypothetical protein